MEQQKLRLEEFREMYRATAKWPPPIRFLVYGFLYWLETKFIDAKTKAEVERAISEYERLVPLTSTPVPILTEKPSEVEGLPELEIRAPWYESRTTTTENQG